MTDRVDELIEIAQRISRGEVPEYEYNECYTSGAYDLLLISAHGPEAYELLVSLCNRFPEVEADGGNLSGYFFLLSQVARQSGTTEMPENMGSIIDRHPELSGDLKQWYRYQG